MPAMRLQKLLSTAGVCSRRQAEAWIDAGRVKVNGELVKRQGVRVDPATDVVEVDGQRIDAEAPESRVLLMYKPNGFMCTERDPQGRRTVHELLPRNIGRVYTVGRLDYHSEGLLLLTNDGQLANALMHPSTGIVREYHVKVKTHPTKRALKKVAQGYTDEKGVQVVPLDVAFLRRTQKNCWYRVIVAEGRNREVRNFFASADLQVLRLVRVAYGPIELVGMDMGDVRPLTDPENKALRAACGVDNRRRRRVSPDEDIPPISYVAPGPPIPGDAPDEDVTSEDEA